MTALDEARAHFAKANEFLEAAQFSAALDLFSAATSNAVLAEIKASGPAGATPAPALARLLKLRGNAQYQAAAKASADAVNAVRWATKLVEGADGTLKGR